MNRSTNRHANYARVVKAAGGSLDPIRVMAIGERWEIPKKGLGVGG